MAGPGDSRSSRRRGATVEGAAERKPSADSERPALYSRRGFLKLAGMSALALGLGGCSSVFPTGGDDAEQIQLVYQDWRTDWFPPMVRRQLVRFRAYHPNIKVFFTPDPEDYLNQMVVDLQSGTAADVFQGCCAHFPGWAQNGYLLDLRSYAERDRAALDMDDWDEVQYESFFLDSGLQYGLPKYYGSLALYYNRDAFDEVGVDYPDATWDHDDYLAAMRQLTRDEDGDGGPQRFGSMIDVGWDRIQAHVNAFGGHFVDPEDPLRCGMADPPALEALEWLRARMWDDRVMATPRDVQNVATRDAFIGGRVAMVEDGSWALRDILEKAPFRVGVAPLPAGPARRVTLSSTDGFGVYAGTEYPEHSWELMKFLVSRPYGLAMAEANFLQPARLSLQEEWKSIVRAAFPVQAGPLELDTFTEARTEGYAVPVEVFPSDMGEATRIANGAWESILVLGQDPSSRIKEAADEIERSQRAPREDPQVDLQFRRIR